jgi:hypothetical protein
MKVIICVLLFSSAIYAQNIGVSVDINDVITDNSARGPFPTGISLLGGFKIIDNLEIEARAGYQLAMVEFRGGEAAVLLNYYFKHPFYVTAGYLYHSNEAAEDEGVKQANASLIGLGAGVVIFKNMSFEVMYFRAAEKKKWKTNWYTRIPLTGVWTESLTGVIRGDIKIYLNL